MTSFLTPELLELSIHPHHNHSVQDPDLTRYVKNSLCGDEVKIEIKIKDKTILDAGFQGEGCSLIKASSSLLMDLIIGQKKADLNIPSDDVWQKHFNNLPDTRKICVLLPLQAIKQALLNQ